MKQLFRQLVVILFTFSIGSALAETDPKAMLQQVADNMISFLKENQSKLAEDESLAKNLVRKELLPYVDEVGLGRRVLAKHWKEASEDQQKMFVEKFVDLVINTYAKGLSQYDGQEFSFEDTELNEAKTVARVKSEMKQKEGEPVRIDYLLKKPKGLDEWRVIDVSIEGISMVQSYRNQFGAEIKKSSLNDMLDKLAKNEIDLSSSK